MAIDWERIGQPAFDRHVEALLFRMFDGQAIAVNGRGGDEGIDVKVRSDAGLHIFQLKYHPDGFPGSHRGRRRAIQQSFRRAMQHDPVEWTLVVPCVLTASERSFVDKLSDDRAVKVSVMDRAALDNGFAVHADLEATFTRDQAREAARDYGREKALLAERGDLVERVRALGSRADGIDPDWTWDFTRRGDMVIQTLRGQHALAQEVSPVRLLLTPRAEAVDAGVRAALNRALGYGIAEEVRLDPEAVESLSIEGPEWLTETVTDVGVIWRPVPLVVEAGTAAEIQFSDTDGARAGRYAGRLIAVGSGGVGRSVEADVHGARLQVLVPFDHQAAGTLVLLRPGRSDARRGHERPAPVPPAPARRLIPGQHQRSNRRLRHHGRNRQRQRRRRGRQPPPLPLRPGCRAGSLRDLLPRSPGLHRP